MRWTTQGDMDGVAMSGTTQGRTALDSTGKQVQEPHDFLDPTSEWRVGIPMNP